MFDRALRFEPLEDRSLLSVFAVANTNDSGDGSLRWAVEQANSTTGADIIEFNSSILTDGAAVIKLDTGELELADTSGTTTINGLGANVLTIDGKEASRVFCVKSGVTADISGLTATKGYLNPTGTVLYPHDTCGAGVFNEGTLTMTGCTISDSSAANGYGGGVYNSGALAMTNCTISGNSANFQGGGIENGGTLTMTACTVSSNYRLDCAGYGGGIDNGNTLTITDSTIANNSNACGNGGGISNFGTLTLTGDTFSGNTVPFANCLGGGIWCYDGKMTIVNSAFYGNSASYGGGIYNCGSQNVSTIANSTIAGNSATISAGGVYSGAITMLDTIVADNIAPSSPDFYSASYGYLVAKYCLIEDAADTLFSSDSANNITGVDPALGAPGNYGGPTQTVPLSADSAAINAGDNILIPSGVTTDQCGNARITNGTVDIGAFEYQGADTTAPTVTINKANTQSNPTNSPTITFTAVFKEMVVGFAAADVTIGGTATFAGNTPLVNVASSDGLTWTIDVSGMNGDGTVTAAIDAGVVADSSGNPNIASSTPGNTVLYDATAPTVLLSLPTSTTASTVSGSVTATDSGSGVADGTTVYLDVDTNNDGDFTDSSDYLGYTSTKLFGGQATLTANVSGARSGTYGIRARTTDAVGNVGVSASSELTIYAGPTISNVAVTAKTSADKTAITWNESDSSGIGATTLTIDNKPVSITTKSSAKTNASFSYSGTLSAGSHSYTITSYNGNKKPSTYTGSFTVSPTTPVISKISIKATTSDKTATIAWTVTDIDGVASTTLAIDGVTITTGIKSSGKNTAKTYTCTGYLAAGSHTYAIDATDSAGASATQATGSATVKATTPVIKNVKSTAKTSADNVTVVWTVYDYDGVGGTTLKIGGTAVDPSSIASIGVGKTIVYTYSGAQTAGNHKYTIDATDSTGLAAKTIAGNFTVKATTPAISSVVATPGYSDTATTIAWNAADVDGIKSCTLKIDGKAVASSKITPTVTANGTVGTTAASYVFSDVLSAGKHAYTIVVVDAAKASASTKNATFTVRPSAPTISDPVLGSNTKGQTTVTWTVTDAADGVKSGTATVTINGNKVSVTKTLGSNGTVATYVYSDKNGLVYYGAAYTIRATDSKGGSALKSGALITITSSVAAGQFQDDILNATLIGYRC
jgi:hypothetical protein